MLTTPPVLAAPTPKEPMLLYITATSRVVSTVIVVERKEEGKALPVQRPVYYLSEVLLASKQNYPHYQKMCYGVHFAAKKLKLYFQEHPITVVCTATLVEIIGSRDASGRVAKWAIDLAPLHHLLSTSHRHQVTSTGRLPRRLGRHPLPAASARLHPLADAL